MTLAVNNTYQFNLVPSGVLPTTIKGRVAIGSMGYAQALRYADVTGLHAQILPALPPGTNADPRNLVYYLIINQDGNEQILANAWLSGEPVVIVEKVVQVLVKVANLEAQTHIADLLRDNGYTDIQLTVL